MTVPEQVRKQSEAVQKLYDDLNTEKAPSPAEGEVAPGVEPPVVPVADPADSVAEVAPVAEVVEQIPAAQEEDPNSETFEQRWRTAQGMYNAEVPRLTAQNQELTARLQSMEQLIATMQTAPKPVAEPEPAPVLESTLTEGEKEEYGDSIDIMRKVSQEAIGQTQQQIAELQSTIKQLQGQIVPRVEQIAHAQAQTADQNFWAELTSTVPNWRAVNDKPEFQAWLLEVDALSGLSRQTFLEDAQRNMDASRVAGFFQAWLKKVGTSDAQSDPTPVPPTELERQVAPGVSRNSGTPQGDKKRTYTTEDIATFFDDVRTGKFVGKETERNEIERDIFAAQHDGRIVSA